MTRFVLLGVLLVGAGTLCKIIPQLAWACGGTTTTTTTLQPPVVPRS